MEKYQTFGIIGRLTSIFIVLAAIVTYFTNSEILGSRIQDFFGLEQKPDLVILMIILIPLALFMISIFVDIYKRCKKYRDFEHENYDNKDENGDWFQIRPFLGTKLDIENYNKHRRQDNIEDHLTDWIIESDEPILFITGKSGTGKSSMVAAAIIPAIKIIKPKLKIITSRIFNNPTEDIYKALKKSSGEKIKPNNLESIILRTDLKKAIKQSPILLIIDQFEEFLLLKENLRKPFEEFLISLDKQPIENFQLLLISSNSDDTQLVNFSDFLPPLRLSENWNVISPYNHKMAISFLKSSIKEISDDLIKDLLNEVHLVDLKGEYRLIILNMLGLALHRNLKPNPRSLLSKGKQKTLIRRFIEQELGNNLHFKQVLAPMVCDGRRKRAMEITDIIQESRLKENVVKAVLTNLQNSGLIRHLSEYENTWEIAHDYIAVSLGMILENWKISVFRKIKPLIIPLLSLLILLVMILPESDSSKVVRYQKELSERGLNLTNYNDGWSIIFDGRKIKDIDEEIDLILEYSKYENVRYLKIVGTSIDSIPKEIGNLSQLTALEIKDNYDLKSIPENLNNMLELTNLVISGNGDIENIPMNLGMLTQLKYFHIHYNNSLRRILVDFRNLPQLEYLQIEDNSSLYEISDTFNNKSNIVSITISNNPQLIELPYTIGFLPKLSSLSLSHNRELKTLPNSIGYLAQLKRLTISGLQSLNYLPLSIGDLKNLSHFEIIRNRNLKVLPDTIGNLSQLNRLIISGNDFLGALPDTIGNLSQLSSLELNGESSFAEELKNKGFIIIETLPDTIGNLSRLNNLVITDFPLITNLPDTIGNLSQLRQLVISNNPKLNNLPDTIGELSLLKSLSISNNSSLVNLPDTIGELSLLESLLISGNSSLVNLPDTIGELSLLKSLSISENSSLVNLPDTIGELSLLKSLTISKNSSLVNLPSSIGNNSQLVKLQIYGNSKLSFLPDSISNLHKLEYVNINDDLITTIPESFEFLSQIDEKGPFGIRIK